MNFVLHGHAVSAGITVGYAHLVATARLEVAHYEIAPDAIEAEVERFDRADACYEVLRNGPQSIPRYRSVAEERLFDIRRCGPSPFRMLAKRTDGIRPMLFEDTLPDRVRFRSIGEV